MKYRINLTIEFFQTLLLFFQQFGKDHSSKEKVRGKCELQLFSAHGTITWEKTQSSISKIGFVYHLGSSFYSRLFVDENWVVVKPHRNPKILFIRLPPMFSTLRNKSARRLLPINSLWRSDNYQDMKCDMVLRLCPWQPQHQSFRLISNKTLLVGCWSYQNK